MWGGPSDLDRDGVRLRESPAIVNRQRKRDG
jgi:hypothetical protein